MTTRMIGIYFICFLISILPLSAQSPTSIIEEDREFWNSLIQVTAIPNKNLLYASYIAYKDKLYDLSIDSFQECVAQNPDSNLIQGIANYYIGKNFYHMGDFKKAALYFLATERYTLDQYTYLKAAALINAAICYQKMDDISMARTYVLKSQQYDTENKYNAIIESLLQSLHNN